MFPVANSQSQVKIPFSAGIMSALEHKSVQGLYKPRHAYSDLTLEELRRHYVTGSCGVLATVIHQLTGWPVYQIATHSYPHSILPRRVGADLFGDPQKPVLVKGGWRTGGIHAFVKNPNTGRFIDAYGAHQSWRQITKTYRRSSLFYGEKVGVRKSKKVDCFRHMPIEYYTLCLLDHIDRMLPEFSPLVAQWRDQEGIPQPGKLALAA